MNRRTFLGMLAGAAATGPVVARPLAADASAPVVAPRAVETQAQFEASLAKAVEDVTQACADVIVPSICIGNYSILITDCDGHTTHLVKAGAA
jgi:hypothetical protein